MSTDKKNTEEEVDLGSLFIIIGKGFSNFFNFIGKIFKGLFHLLILFLLFLKKHFLKFTIAAIIGGVIGFFIEINSEVRYSSDMVVQPNFNSTLQLYSNIELYNDLVKQKDTLQLASIFNISKEKAGTLKNFGIAPIVTSKDVLEAYNELILEIDTLSARSYPFEEFEKAFTNYNYKVHSIHAESTDNKIFKSLGKSIIKAITENIYFCRLKELNDEDLNRTDSILRRDLTQVDSLRNVYMKVMIEEAQKESKGTNIDLGGDKISKAKEIELFGTNRQINAELKKISIDKGETSNIINIISDFQDVGHKINEINKNYTFLFFWIGLIGMFVILVFKELNTYLNNYKKQ